ncbi:hypothetical protein [Streptomyces sp. NPDC003077]|uniref:hypothetical protein n=1 Tax=Streptomyces sp. NPDC003077 TaxID=3154443 RepID=UPI0033B3FF87
MIPIRRPPLPPELNDRAQALTRKILNHDAADRTQRARSLWKSSPVRDEILATLQNMAHGISACMYCGHHMADTVDHYVPLSENPAQTFCRHNHLLSCSTCNSRYKLNNFEREILGVPKLIDPTREDPFDHLHLNIDTGIYQAITARGEYTLRICGLNERRLPEARERARRDIQLHLEGWSRAHSEGNDARLKDFTAAIREQPLSVVCQSMLRQARHPAAEVFFSAFPGLLLLLRMPELHEALLITHDDTCLHFPGQRRQLRVR